MKEGPLYDFISAFFHRFNNLLGGFYGKLELIVVYGKEEAKKKLPPAEVLGFFDTMRQIRGWLVSAESFEMAKQIGAAESAGVLSDFFLDRQKRFVKSMEAAEADPAIRKEIGIFIKEVGELFPEVPEMPDPGDFSEIFGFAQKLLTFTQKSQSKWFDGPGEKMI